MTRSPSRLVYGPHPSQFLDRFESKAPPIAEAVLIHGGYWRNRYGLDLMDPMAERLVSLGWAVTNIEYRRVGDSDDPWSAMSADVIDALGIAPTNLPRVLVGHSAGGQLALWAASKLNSQLNLKADVKPVSGVVALAPLADLVEADAQQLSGHATAELFGSAPDLRAIRMAEASPRQLLPLGVPQFVIHGGADDSVPQAMSIDYGRAAAAAGDPIELVLPNGVDHFEIIDPTSAVWPTIEAAISRLGIAEGP